MSNRETTCEDLSAYLDGELSDADVRRVEQALRADATLARELAQLRATRALVRGAPRQKAPDDFVARVLAQAERTHLVGAQPAGESPGVLRWARHFATAAMLLISLGIGGVIVYTLWNTRQMPQTAISMGGGVKDGDVKRDVGGGSGFDARKDAEKVKEFGDKPDGMLGKAGGGHGSSPGKGGAPAKGYSEYDDSSLVSVDRLMVNVADPDKDAATFAQVLAANNFKRMDDRNAARQMIIAATTANGQNTQTQQQDTQNTLARNTLPPQGFYYVEQLNNDQVALVVNGVQDGREAHNLKEGLNNKIQEQRIPQPRRNWDEVAQLDTRNSEVAKKDQAQGGKREMKQAESLDQILEDAMAKHSEDMARNIGKTRGGVSETDPGPIANAPSAPAAGPAPSPAEDDKFKHEGQKPADFPAAMPTSGGKLGPGQKPEGWTGDAGNATTRPAVAGEPAPVGQRPAMPATQPAAPAQDGQQRIAGQGQSQMKQNQNMRAVVIVLNRALDAEAAKPASRPTTSAPASQPAK